MATQTQAPADTPESDVVKEPAIPEKVEGRKYDPRKFVYVYDSESGVKLNDPVPETWLDGRFPQLSLTPSKKAGK